MQQRLQRSGEIEIAGFAPYRDVGKECSSKKQVLANLHKFGWKQANETISEPGRQTGRERGEDTPDTPAVKIRERKALLGHFLQKDGRDQKARNDEKYVDADITAVNRFRKRVIENDRKHGKSSQPVDVRAIARFFKKRKAGFHPGFGDALPVPYAMNFRRAELDSVMKVVNRLIVT